MVVGPGAARAVTSAPGHAAPKALRMTFCCQAAFFLPQAARIAGR